MKTKYLFLNIVIIYSLISFTSCKKDSYFVNEKGISNPTYNGTILQYLSSNHIYFDTLSAIIKYSGMEDIFNNDSITFFAPPDSTIKASIRSLNNRFFSEGRQQISSFKQIKPETWRTFLSMYIIKGLKRLNDFPQIDVSNLLAFSGQYYRTIDSTLINVGVVYSDLQSNGAVIQYGGYRYVMISYVSSEAAPTVNRVYAQVASSDVNPNNGIVHVISITGFGNYSNSHFFGFSTSLFYDRVVNDGILY